MPLITMPTDPIAPASVEFQKNAIVAANTNPFTGQQQLQQWSTGYWEASVSYQPMPFAQAQPWVTFLTSLIGMANTFHFSTTVCAAYPIELTTDGTTPRVWRLKTNVSKWSIERGSIYSFVFEIREAI